ncbi:MAG: hypothetical protein HY326_09510 [Chloroflexi bacterium]|nr:hypothetical protein [Chloroflexota bacterium]
MPACAVHIEPMVRASITPDPVISISDLDIVKVLLFAQGFEYQRAAKPTRTPRYWYMNLPEQIYANGENWRFQSGMQWRNDQGRWSYTGAPIRNLFGLWQYVDHKPMLDHTAAAAKPVIGRQSAGIWADDTGVHYYVGVKNETGAPWRDVYQWICFNSYLSPETGFRPYFHADAGWTPFQDIPGIAQHTYFPVQGLEPEFRRSLGKRSKSTSLSLTIPAVAAWNMVDEGPLLTCHYSQHAVAVGSNQQWPCTDLFLWYGDIAPGEEQIRWGHVWIGSATLAEFSAILHTLIPQWQEREH